MSTPSPGAAAALPRFLPSGHPATEIRRYYGDTGTGRVSPTSEYLRDVERVMDDVHHFVAGFARGALVLDIDDTLLSTYAYGAASDFAGYDDLRALAGFVLGKQPTAVSGMPEFTRAAAARGLSLFYLTNRPDQARAVTLENLREQGYPDPAGLFTKPADQPHLSTTQFKSSVRARLASLGHDLLANVGDQQSDLDGGYARRAFRLPNRMYLLP
ncbi:hypothetical protein KIH74_22035 [Kineosporia sp. J2-2]|uniref:Acid phosphatase of HAD superfamily subfamily IIIB n=1 Tax=Kineosporia corallincola TaxID=2835133 RepID=A0ABS5TKK9_9ACTN|nr:HAD family acid phosphatase [Kineosporia corallincola]MBT0771635.1 hypothetical protein [Kineosporia corallincola]